MKNRPRFLSFEMYFYSIKAITHFVFPYLFFFLQLFPCTLEAYCTKLNHVRSVQALFYIHLEWEYCFKFLFLVPYLYHNYHQIPPRHIRLDNFRSHDNTIHCYYSYHIHFHILDRTCHHCILWRKTTVWYLYY